MGKFIVNIHGDIEGDYEIIGKYQEPKTDVLDKIKRDIFDACSDNYHMPIYKLNCDEIFEIIDKYN